MSKILVVNDNLQRCELLTKVLKKAGYQVDYVCDGQRALGYQRSLAADLIIFDMSLPHADALNVISKICEDFATPLLISTPINDEQTALDGLQAGADQFLVRPYSNEALITCVSSLLRRVALEKQRLTFHHCSQQFSLKVARIAFTETEMLLMQYLSKNDGVIMSKAILQKEVLKKELCLFDRNLDVHISNIRRKMKHAGLSKLHIQTVHGKGYLFSEKVI